MTTTSRPTIAVVGATGAVGRVIQQVLPLQQRFWGDLRLAAALEDVGQVCRIGADEVVVEELTPAFFDGVDIALVDLPPAITITWVETAVERGVTVIDNSPSYRLDPDVPLVVPEINPDAVRHRPEGIIANPGAIVLTMIDVLGVLHRGWDLRSAVLTTFHAASGMGRQGMARLYDEIDLVAGDHALGQAPGDVRRLVEHELGTGFFPGPLALNVLPWVGAHVGRGHTSEELMIGAEVRKILGKDDLLVSATCVRVPVMSSHSVSAHLTFNRRIDPDRARHQLMMTSTVVVVDDPERAEFPTPNDVVGADPRFVGRVRQVEGAPKTLDVFACGDNLRKGAALNMVQVAALVAAEK